jgi:Arc/MetJ-type ribon-helix-helix transcriptional regulator
MEVVLTESQQALARMAVESGRLSSIEEAGRQAMLLWEDYERERLDIVRSLEESMAAYRRGEYRRVETEEDRAQMIADIRRRGLARLQSESTQAA